MYEFKTKQNLKRSQQHTEEEARDRKMVEKHAEHKKLRFHSVITMVILSQRAIRRLTLVGTEGRAQGAATAGLRAGARPVRDAVSHRLLKRKQRVRNSTPGTGTRVGVSGGLRGRDGERDGHGLSSSEKQPWASSGPSPRSPGALATLASLSGPWTPRKRQTGVCGCPKSAE